VSLDPSTGLQWGKMTQEQALLQSSYLQSGEIDTLTTELLKKVQVNWLYISYCGVSMLKNLIPPAFHGRILPEDLPKLPGEVPRIYSSLSFKAVSCGAHHAQTIHYFSGTAQSWQ